MRVPHTLLHSKLVPLASLFLSKLYMAMQMNSIVHASPPPPQAKKDQEPTEVAVHVAIADDVPQSGDEAGPVDYSGRAQWLRAAVLGANDGLVSVASLMIGVGAVNQSARAMLVSGLAGLVAGACSMAIGEFVSVYAQYDIEVAQLRRRRRGADGDEVVDSEAEKIIKAAEESRQLPSPAKAAAASALAFSAGAALPLLAGGFVRPWAARVAAVCAATTASLGGFGVVGAVVGGASPARSASRVLLGGWAAMAVCYGVLWLFGLAFGAQVSAAT